MVPLVGTRAELSIIKQLIDRTAQAVFAETGASVPYLVGTMIELPRACLMAGQIAGEAEFFSFGTNDLTQTTLGVSRDDAGHFLTAYVEKGIYARDPFVSLDVEGVGQLITMAAERGKAARPDIKLGICGRAWRRSRLHRLLRGDRPRLCQCFALPNPHREARGCTGGTSLPVTPSRWSGAPGRPVDGQRIGVQLFEPAMLHFQRFAAADLVLVAALPLGAGKQVHAEHQPEQEDQAQDDELVGRERGHKRTPR
jgi:hypothetical protein